MSSLTLLLDTHVWIWLVEGSHEINAKRRTTLENAWRENGLAISMISIWEVGMLEAKARIDLQIPIAEWVEQASAGLSVVPISVEIALESSRLPGSFHGDPADRILAATARLNEMPFYTRDRKLVEYGKLKYIKVRDV